MTDINGLREKYDQNQFGDCRCATGHTLCESCVNSDVSPDIIALCDEVELLRGRVSKAPDRDAIRDAIDVALGGDAYDCTRVWSAWSYGTMDQDDFAPIVENEDRLMEIVDAVLGAMKETP